MGRYRGTTLIETTAPLHLRSTLLEKLRRHLEAQVDQHEALIGIIIDEREDSLVVRMDLQTSDEGYLDEIADTILENAFQALADDGMDSPGVLGSSLVPA